MPSLESLLTLVHLTGLALGVGCATAKLVLLLKCRTDHSLLPAYLVATRPITRLIIIGLLLLTLSGIGLLLQWYPFTPLVVLKLVLVGAIWVIGPIIDKVFEPKFKKLVPGPGEPASPAFIRIRGGYLALEVTATGLFWVILVMWLLLA